MDDIKECAQDTYNQMSAEKNPLYRALTQLQQHPRFQYGHRHVLVTLRYFLFNGELSRKIYQPLIENITLGNSFYPIACQRLLDNQAAGDYERKFRKELAVTKSNMVLGLGISDDLPLQMASTERFQQAHFWIFYHTRIKKSANGATPYRRAPLKSVNWTAFNSNSNDNYSPRDSSVGYDIDWKTWKDHFVSSRFCLTIRGDIPNSHSLLRAVRAGCIPVVISDLYQEYAGPFKSLIHLSNFSIILPETDFLRDPQASLGQLQVLSQQDVQSKLDGLALAQKMLFPDHPESLFVQSFLEDAQQAMKDFHVFE